LTSHFPATRRYHGADVIFDEVVYDHALQRRIVLDYEDAYLAITAPAQARII
jgi:hypothetical protein